MDVARQGRVLTGSDLFDDWSSTGLLRSAYCHPTQLTTPLAQGRSAENALPAWGTGCFFWRNLPCTDLATPITGCDERPHVPVHIPIPRVSVPPFLRRLATTPFDHQRPPCRLTERC